MGTAEFEPAVQTAQVIAFRSVEPEAAATAVDLLHAIRTRLQLVETLLEDCGRDLARLEDHEEFEGLVALSIELSRLCSRLA